MEDAAPYLAGPPARQTAAAARALFLDAFSSAWHGANDGALPGGAASILDRYHSDSPAWTACMVGGCRDWPTSGVPVLRDAITRYALLRGYDHTEISDRLRAEGIAHVDLTFAGGREALPDSVSRYHYARRFELLVEHENNPTSIYEEAWKLLKVRADLAVLVSYHPHDGRRANNRARPIDMVQAQVQAAVAERDGVEPGRFLVILGQSMTSHPWIRWDAFEFDDRGSLIDAEGRELSP